MFRIMRGITIDPAPAYPSPALRFPDGTPIPIHVGEEEIADTKLETAAREPEPAEIGPST